MERIFSPNSDEDQKNGLYQKLERIFCPNAVKDQNKKDFYLNLEMPMGGRGYFLFHSRNMLKRAKSGKTWYFPYSACQWEGAKPLPPSGYATARAVTVLCREILRPKLNKLTTSLRLKIFESKPSRGMICGSIQTNLKTLKHRSLDEILFRYWNFYPAGRHALLFCFNFAIYYLYSEGLFRHSEACENLAPNNLGERTR